MSAKTRRHVLKLIIFRPKTPDLGLGANPQRCNSNSLHTLQKLGVEAWERDYIYYVTIILLLRKLIIAVNKYNVKARSHLLAMRGERRGKYCKVATQVYSYFFAHFSPPPPPASL